MMNGEACHGACPQATTPLRPVAARADSVCGQDPTGNLDVPDVYPGNTLMLPVFHDGAYLYVGDGDTSQGSEFRGEADESGTEGHPAK
jgi:acetamidase/formamidase